MKKQIGVIQVSAVLALTLASCGLAENGEDSAAQNDNSVVDSNFPVTVTNCGQDVTIETAPERIFIVNNDDVALLDGLASLDLVVARTAELTEGVYSDEVVSALNSAELIETETNATGGSVISIEKILDADPDLVLSPENAVNREALESAGIPLYSPPAYCSAGAPAGEATFSWVYDQVETFGKMLGKQDVAADLIAELEAKSAETSEDNGTAAALYVPAGGGSLSPYGGPSMVTPVFAAAGLSNIYADSEDRVFELSIEDLISRDPQTIVLLYSDGAPETAIENFQGVAGIEDLSAVKNDRVIALQFPYTDPPTPLSVQGVQELKDSLAALQ